MTWRRAALYWLTFAALSAYYVIALRTPDGSTAAPLQRAPFLDVREPELQRLEVRRAERTLRFARSAGRWQVVEPSGVAVAADLVAALVSAVAEAPAVEMVAAAGADLTQFGLDPPASELTLTAAAAPIVVRLGGRNPAGTAVYAQRLPDPQVFLIGLNVRYYEDLLFEALAAGLEAPAHTTPER